MQQQKQYKVLLIGETCEDSYIFGSVDRISPEAPVPVVKHEETLTALGMSENVKRNLQAFGVNVTHITNKKLIKKGNGKNCYLYAANLPTLSIA